MRKFLTMVYTMILIIVPQTINAGLNAEPSEHRMVGIASYYGSYHHGKTMANGDPFDMYDMTCAHKTLPFGTKLRVTNINNGKSVEVIVTDRGPYVKGRVIDLSKGAFKKIAPIDIGITKVEIEEI